MNTDIRRFFYRRAARRLRENNNCNQQFRVIGISNCTVFPLRTFWLKAAEVSSLMTDNPQMNNHYSHNGVKDVFDR